MNDSDIRDLHLGAGEIHFGAGNTRIHTTLGTCVSITLWHPIKRMGGICHFLLPTRPTTPLAPGREPGLYADEVMGAFAETLRANQTLPGEYVVKITGGGHMFPEYLLDIACRKGACLDARRGACESIGCKNICAARTLLADAGYLIRAEDVGGHGSRQLIFELWTGDTLVRRGESMSSLPRAVA
jgi:chemotaxis protein CheD